MTPVVLSLAGSGLGILFAVGFARLFQWLRRAAPDPVSYAGNGLVTFSGIFCIIFFSVAPLLLIPHLLVAGIVWYQSRQPSRIPLSWVQLLGITVVEMLTASFAGWSLSTVVGSVPGGLGSGALFTGEDFAADILTAFVIVLLLLETVGPPRWREAFGR